MPTSIHAAGPNGQRSPGLDAAIAAWHAENPDTGGSGGDTTVQIGTVTLPESPTEGLSVSVLADSDTVLPEGVTWDSGGEPTITERMLLVFVWSGTDWVGTYGPPIPAPPVSSDTTGPTAGTLGVVPGVTTADLTVTGASDDTALHATPYAFSTNNGSTWSAYQAGATYEATGLTADTSYTFRHRVRDAAGNVTVGTAVTDSTDPAPADSTPPTPGTLAASAITSDSFTLTVTGASDDQALHGTPYRFSTDNGTTYSAWQAGATFNVTELDPETEYTCVHQVRDAALNVTTGSSIAVETEAATYRSAVLADSPGVYLPLDDATWPVVEETGTYTAGMGLTLPTGQPGTTTTAPTLGAAGLGDGATSASFDGVDNAFVLSAPSLPSALRTAASVTVEALINVTSLSVDTTFLSRDNYLSGASRAWIFQVTSTGELKATKLGTGDYGTIVSSPTGSIVVGTTYHVAFTHDGTTLRIYINGAMVGSGAASGLMGASSDSAHLTVGATGRGTPPNFFHGRLAGVAWTPTALSDARILAHAAAAGLT